MSALSNLDREMLAFERNWWKQAGAREGAIRELFDLTPTRYHQLLNRLIDKPAAMAAEPVVVGRLRRQRDEAQRRRGRLRLPETFDA